jgi:hypothetical protein
MEHPREDDVVLDTIPYVPPAPEVARDGPVAPRENVYGMVLHAARVMGFLPFYDALYWRDWEAVVGFLQGD